MFVSEDRALPAAIFVLLRKFEEFLRPIKPAPLVDEGIARFTTSSRGSFALFKLYLRLYSALTSGLKKGCCRHCMAVGLLWGSHYSIFSIKSIASVDALGMIVCRGVTGHRGKSIRLVVANW